MENSKQLIYEPMVIFGHNKRSFDVLNKTVFIVPCGNCFLKKTKNKVIKYNNLTLNFRFKKKKLYLIVSNYICLYILGSKQKQTNVKNSDFLKVFRFSKKIILQQATTKST